LHGCIRSENDLSGPHAHPQEHHHLIMIIFEFYFKRKLRPWPHMVRDFDKHKIQEVELSCSLLRREPRIALKEEIIHIRCVTHKNLCICVQKLLLQDEYLCFKRKKMFTSLMNSRYFSNCYFPSGLGLYPLTIRILITKVIFISKLIPLPSWT
jgi:hypothetical protein